MSYISVLQKIRSGHGLLPVWHQATTSTCWFVISWASGRTVSDLLIKLRKYSAMKRHWKKFSPLFKTLCSGRNIRMYTAGWEIHKMLSTLLACLRSAKIRIISPNQRACYRMLIHYHNSKCFLETSFLLHFHRVHVLHCILYCPLVDTTNFKHCIFFCDAIWCHQGPVS